MDDQRHGEIFCLYPNEIRLYHYAYRTDIGHPHLYGDQRRIRLLGGYITTIDIQASESTALASRILKGEKASQIPISQSSKKHIVDWNELARWKISEDSLPDDYVVVNIPFHIRYKTEIMMLSMFLCLFIIALIVYLSYLYSRESKRKREAQST